MLRGANVSCGYKHDSVVTDLHREERKSPAATSSDNPHPHNFSICRFVNPVSAKQYSDVVIAFLHDCSRLPGLTLLHIVQHPALRYHILPLPVHDHQSTAVMLLVAALPGAAPQHNCTPPIIRSVVDQSSR